MNKEEFDKAFSLVNSYMLKAPTEIENAYKLLKSDYVNQSKNGFYLQQRIDKAIEYMDIGERINSCSIYDVNGIEVYKILRGEE